MPWYAVHTRSRHEYKVKTSLVQKGINAFLPEIEVPSKRKDRKKKINIPLFSGYLFFETSFLDNETKLAVLKTFGVVRILGKKDTFEPLPVPENKIAAIRRLVETKAQIFEVRSPKVGEPARIIDGPFAGIEGIVVSRNAQKELFVVTIEILQRCVAVKLEGLQVARLQA
ncbi:MAG TPA: UpxY family transcription antiterminator [Deltaproteobacteria bacterium]|nr:UpxY family transcription antiterminator [Deltaproteobacteria bacterium]